MAVSFSQKSKEKIEHLIKCYPNKRAPLIPVLTIAQEEFGFLSEEVKALVATTLDLNLTEIQEVITFYSQFKQKQIGKIHFQVCKTLSCDIAGGKSILEYLKEKLGVEPNEVTADGQFSYEGVECLASCDTAPAMFCQDKYVEKLTKQEIDSILSSRTL